MRGHGHSFEDYGELVYCERCMGFEGSLPSECPGEIMTEGVSDRVYAGVLDYVRGRWAQTARKGLVLRFKPYGCPGAPLDAVDRWGAARALARHTDPATLNPEERDRR